MCMGPIVINFGSTYVDENFKNQENLDDSVLILTKLMVWD